MSPQAPSGFNERETQPTRWSGLVFASKAWGLRLARASRDIVRGRPQRHAVNAALRDAPILAEFESSLWPKDETDQTLVAGKIQNLRLAAKALDGLEIPANEIFSFWRQLGRASAGRGFVEGRELREGCVIPAIGGGLCQLSNAIYDSAVRAGLEIVERHRHSRALPGSLAELDRDATVFWNYLDLRLRGAFAWRLEVRLDESAIRLRIRAAESGRQHAVPIQLGAKTVVDTGDCSTCDEHACHRHVGMRALSPHRTWLIDEYWPEFVVYRNGHRDASARVLGGPDERARLGVSRISNALIWLRWRIALWCRLPIPQARTQRQERIARTMMSRLRPEDLHLVVSQGLLPYLWRDGELAGRRFDVLMNALPMTALQSNLDAAAARHPTNATLRDFRAPAWLIEAETEALAHAHRWISPHAQIVVLAGSRGECLPWHNAPIASVASRKRTAAGEKMQLFFPASSLARKGALELREALEEFPVELLLLGGTDDSPDFWRGFDVRRMTSIAEGIAQADIVALPAWVEHQPRGLLAAIALGIPVIATDACGLSASMAWQRVEAGDAVALRAAIERAWADVATRDDVVAV